MVNQSATNFLLRHPNIFGSTRNRPDTSITMVRRHQNHRRQRYNYSPHDSSPHFPVLNILIGIVVTLCLWNVWTAPPPARVMESTMGGQVMQQNQQLQRQSSQQQVEEVTPIQMSSLSSLSTMSNTSQDITSVQDEIHLFPVHTAANGQKFIVLSSGPSRQTTSPRSPEQQEGEFGQAPRVIGNVAKKSAGGKPTKTNTYGEKSSRKQSDTLSVPKTISRHKKEKKIMTPNQRGLSTPLFIDTVSYEPLSSSSPGSSSSQAHHHFRPYWYSWFLGIAISGSVLAGGLLAKRVLKRMDRWEQLSKEDSLAFDVAYTTAFVYDEDAQSYGSFVETTSDWSRDNLDRFDV
jgi:hypothetical protein